MNEVMHCSNCANKNITHDFQDSKYGKFNRIMNKKESGGYVCTVCGDGSKKKRAHQKSAPAFYYLYLTAGGQ